MPRKKTYVQVGVGGRSEMFRHGVLRDHSDRAIMAAYCDNNVGRAELWAQEAHDKYGVEVRTYSDREFVKMIKTEKPDTVIVTTKDSTHDKYICKAMEMGCDVVTEKPMTTDARKCQKIIETQKKTGQTCTVTFNYRYAPPRTQVKDLLMKGVIGDILSVDFHWMLDTYHGADYFRRWHRNKKNSGGLMVHKSTHHFDLVNWWLSAIPEEVYATGHRKFYTPETATRLGLTRRGERCHTCKDAAKCAFGLSMAANPDLKKIYLENEEYDGYHRDQCVFSPEMDIEDSMNVLVNYDTGAKLCYSLNAYCAWEGYVVAFNGTRGRLEHACQESVYINGDGSVPGELQKDGTYIKIFPIREPAYQVDLWEAKGGHGGADPLIVEEVLAPTRKKDPYKRAADHRSGAYSILCGIAANKAMKTKKPVRIETLVKGLERPDYTRMPSTTEKIPMFGEMPGKSKGLTRTTGGTQKKTAKKKAPRKPRRVR